MNQLCIPLSFTATRARRTDCDTSLEAAKNAANQKAAHERVLIRQALAEGPMTAREIAAATGLDYIEVQRRISEVAGIHKTDEKRGGCRVWSAL